MQHFFQAGRYSTKCSKCGIALILVVEQEDLNDGMTVNSENVECYSCWEKRIIVTRDIVEQTVRKLAQP